MKFLRRSSHLAVAMILACGVPSFGQQTGEQKADVSSAFNLIFSDDFSEDSLSEYQVKGEVTWKPGRVKLSEGSSVSRSFEAGARVEVVAELEFPKLTNDGELSLALLQLDLRGAMDCLVAWGQKRAAGKTVSNVFVFGTVSKDGKDSLKKLSSVSFSGPLESGVWSVERRHGLLYVRRDGGDKVVSCYISKGTPSCSGLHWLQTRGHGILNRLAVRGASRSAPLSEEQQEKVTKAQKQNSQLVQLYREGKFAEATRLGESILEIRRKVLGVEHPAYAQSLNNLALMYKSNEEFAKAEPLFLKACHISKSVVGVEHPEYAKNLINLAALYTSLENAAKAEPLFLKARDIFKRVVGVEHPGYATSLNSLARLYLSQGDLVKAELLLLEARDIRKRVLGAQHPDYTTSLNNLAVLFHSRAEFAKAEPLYLEVRDIRKRVLGVDHPHYATSLNNLAGLYQSQGDSVKAELLYLEVRDIRKRVLGVEHSDYATSLSALAGVYSSQGEFAKAEALFLEARDIRKRVLGVEHSDYAMSLNALAGVYRSQGDEAKGEPLTLEAHDILKRVLGVQHPDYARSLNALAIMYISQGEAKKAETLCLEAIDIGKRALGDSHPSYAQSLNNLAVLYQSNEEFAKAEPLLLKSRDIRKRVLGIEHPGYTESLHNLAILYGAQGKFAKAEPLLLESRDIRKRVLGIEHPDYAESLSSLAMLYGAQGYSVKAEPLYRESVLLSRQQIKRNAAGQSQSTQLKYAATLRIRLDSWMSHCLQSSGAGKALFDEVLTWKGMTLLRQCQYRLAEDDERTRPILESLTGVTRQLAFLLRQTPTTQTQKVWRERIAVLTEQRDTLEAQLATASEEFRAAGQRLRTDELLELLPEDAVMVDLLSFNFLQRVPKDDYYMLQSRRHFLASILRKGQPVQFVNLGPEADINAAVDKWRAVFLSNASGDASKVEPAGRELRRLIWEPLMLHLADAKTIILSPDRSLGRVAFAALPGRKPGTYLIEDHRLAYVPVPQLMPRLLRYASTNQSPQRNVLLIGDVDYNAGSVAAADVQDALIRVPKAEELFENQAFTPLIETAGEVAAIRDLFLELHQTGTMAVKLLQKQQATESAFRQYAGQYQTLHIATHGFFADASKKSVEHYAAEEHSHSRSGLFGMHDESMAHIRGFHPGMLSGLALAGANHAAAGAGEDDGILTADETSFLRLEGVDLVVLSACETGLGAVAGGEGLLGVQRAFQVSGARSVVASLWNVDDVATRRLMERFYRNLWEKKMSRLDSLREAQLWMLNNPESIEGTIERGTLVRLKMPLKGTSPKRGKPTTRTDPRFWAAFTLSGDWR